MAARNSNGDTHARVGSSDCTHVCARRASAISTASHQTPRRTTSKRAAHATQYRKTPTEEAFVATYFVDAKGRKTKRTAADFGKTQAHVGQQRRRKRGSKLIRKLRKLRGDDESAMERAFLEAEGEEVRRTPAEFHACLRDVEMSDARSKKVRRRDSLLNRRRRLPAKPKATLPSAFPSPLQVASRRPKRKRKRKAESGWSQGRSTKRPTY